MLPLRLSRLVPVEPSPETIMLPVAAFTGKVTKRIIAARRARIERATEALCVLLFVFGTSFVH
jgi:hypothetical protein